MLIDFSEDILPELKPETEFEAKVVDFVEDWFFWSKTVPVKTSGSTGTPKVFEVEKARMLNSAQMTCDFLGLEKGDSALLCLPIEYISGKMMVVRAIERGLKLFVVNPSSKPLENFRGRIDFGAMTPLQVENSLDKIHLIKNLIIGGAAVSERLRYKIQESRTKNQKPFFDNYKVTELKEISGEPSANGHQPTAVYETYGMSETLSHIALKQIAPEAQHYFKTFDGVEISTDERGCLRIFAPKLNAEILQTNDLVEIKNGREFRFLGRIDNVINSGGAKIFPEQLEALAKKEITNEIVFLGMEDEVFGQKLIAVIEGRESEKLTEIIYNLPYEKSFHKPKEIVFIPQIPRTPNGKVDRIQLRKALQ
ncbi:O-succinylbenzoic acid--CoA ligase [Cruoricaptor ignavus]|uniref:O-succinylbenzoic acid--CoA ligase n=1 Tax=Cruoricaptor ignavus TaxID=1118202 RepID=A0A1M6DC07_9FLAO|nr:AMP-binding protein [Cruoricaptor ignavus]SHI70705.1 O-succinylbenzoic acid--CoA ligase [Cruoricaptor ignavus]